MRLGQARGAARLFGASASLSAAHAVDPRFPVSRGAHRERPAERACAARRAEPFRRAWDAGRAAGSAEIAELVARGQAARTRSDVAAVLAGPEGLHHQPDRSPGGAPSMRERSSSSASSRMLPNIRGSWREDIESLPCSPRLSHSATLMCRDTSGRISRSSRSRCSKSAPANCSTSARAARRRRRGRLPCVEGADGSAARRRGGAGPASSRPARSTERRARAAAARAPRPRRCGACAARPGSGAGGRRRSRRRRVSPSGVASYEPGAAAELPAEDPVDDDHLVDVGSRVGAGRWWSWWSSCAHWKTVDLQPHDGMPSHPTHSTPTPRPRSPWAAPHAGPSSDDHGARAPAFVGYRRANGQWGDSESASGVLQGRLSGVAASRPDYCSQLWRERRGLQPESDNPPCGVECSLTFRGTRRQAQRSSRRMPCRQPGRLRRSRRSRGP